MSPLLVLKVAVLMSRPLAAYDEALAGIKEGLGEDAQLEVLDMRGNVVEGRKLARKVEDGGYAACVTVGPEASVVAKNETTRVPTDPRLEFPCSSASPPSRAAPWYTPRRRPGCSGMTTSAPSTSCWA